MNKDKYAIESLAMDLKRAALGYHSGSEKTAKRFSEEALKRKEEIAPSNLKPYFRKIINSLPQVLSQKDKRRLAEDALMYSTMVQNYASKNF